MKSVESGIQKINWAESHCSVLNEIRSRFLVEKPFEGYKIGLCIHLEAKTAFLCKVLQDGGADMYVAGSNPLSTQDDVADALRSMGMHVYAKHGDHDNYIKYLQSVLSNNCNIIIDDGGDLVHELHTTFKDTALKHVIGGCEETTTGINRLNAMCYPDELKFPMIKVNDARCKHLFDNRYGTGQSVWDNINRITNLIVAGKVVVVAGYGWCGKGVSMRAKGLGARVIVTEIDPVKAIEAVMDGFEVMTMDEACVLGDIFITVTGCKDVIVKRHFVFMKDGAIVCNAGHFDVEVDVDWLNKNCSSSEVRNNIIQYEMEECLRHKKINVLSQGRLVNLASGDGHPVEIMDMSFSVQALCAEYIVDMYKQNIDNYGDRYFPDNLLQDVPSYIDDEIAEMKLRTLGISIDKLTRDQENYLYHNF